MHIIYSDEKHWALCAVVAMLLRACVLKATSFHTEHVLGVRVMQ